MNKVSILDFDINNGEGIRVSLWVSGCPHECDGCHNANYWDKKVGKEFTFKDINMIVNLLEKDISKDFSVLGGEPLAPYNVKEVTEICKEIKFKYPNKNIWIWTGYQYENFKDKEIMKYIDVLIDGKFIKELYDSELKWRGSSNQRIIDVQKSLQQDKVVLYDC
ncbi:anaerobic ribonucleoside-triphosphate reductase activating protein [Clostridium botulinum]|uniref:anaerobic ribonucleoside-triphosphate reductase activating protein n=1 Tax=Clostridium botulinum TaxID=1491 RepID=UPI0009941DAD|nr:anaerobic ribonucleoside-triphosphate reductase activating protein [Clostridium botulinum]NFO99066.1 anaerobic ribonucleoside-triphosphate reductase activating protein [Clostridium botulinum]OOV52388.1 anaerobic ribonucleoside-triphosphate reductase activating protein [Clostridium botulinum D/C]OOV55742.1 anaerobic ribonucleoside-triphosphate reductase activating protein [Clostridium botulinum D/C]OOV57189.1 anaerobic ribonucleoside-triphosphate reductase activating protein [Clostridium botu